MLITLRGHFHKITSVAFSPDGKKCLAGFGDGAACVWDSTTGELIKKVQWQRKALTSVAFSPDGERCLTGSEDDSACVWDSTTGVMLAPFMMHRNALLLVTFSPDGRFIITASVDGNLSMWDSKKAELLQHFRPHDCLKSVVISQDRKLIIVGLEGKICLWKNMYSSTWFFKQEEKAVAFKLFMALYPLVQKKSDLSVEGSDTAG